MPLESWVQHSRHDMFLYDWETLVGALLAGAFAVAAAFLTIWATFRSANKEIEAAQAQIATTVRLEHERLSREVEALRVSLAGEIRLYIDLLIKTRDILKRPEIEVQFLASEIEDYRQRDLRDLAVLHPPTVYPAVADRLGLISRPRAADVVAFYATIERINFSARAATNEPTKAVSASNYLTLIKLFEDACRGSLPLLSELPVDERDVEFRAKIEAMIT